MHCTCSFFKQYVTFEAAYEASEDREQVVQLYLRKKTQTSISTFFCHVLSIRSTDC